MCGMAKYGGNLMRTLGRLETLFHVYHKHGIANYVQMVRLRCVQSVQLSEVRKAMEILHLQHPVLRMFIRETKEPAQFQFVEMNPMKIDCRISSLPTENLLQKELNTNFDPNGPLWRITVQRRHNAGQKNGDICDRCRKHNDGFPYKFSFAMTSHHSLVDGMYMLYIFADFIELLDKIQKNLISSNDIQPRNIPPPFEQTIQTIRWTGNSIITPSLCSTVTSQHTLIAYKQRFDHEINCLKSNPVQANAVRTKIVQRKTKKFLSDCKLQGILVSGAIVAASCIAFTKQVKLNISSQVKVLEIPVEVMVDLRRYISSVEDFAIYPGTVAIHLPFLVKIPLCENLDSKELFWQIARTISDDLYQAIHSTKPIKFMIDEVEKAIDSHTEKEVGKSPYVLAISNLGNVDHIVRPWLKPRFQLEEFPGLTMIDIDNHPIFEIDVFSFSGQFHFIISYCSRYTSKETAARFSWDMTQVIQNTTML